MEFYKTATKIRTELTNWMLRDFGAKKYPKNVNRVIKQISEEDEKVINDIFAKYGKTPNKEFQSEYPDWFIKSELKIIGSILNDMMTEIIKANTYYPKYEFEWKQRRIHQDEAIGLCYKLYNELHHIETIIPQNLNLFCEFLGDIESEVNLLKKWRQSDLKSVEKFEKEIV